MSRIQINIGSNQGDRAAHIERAVALVAHCLDPGGRAEIRVSPIVESKPWGYESPNPFLNIGMMIDLKEEHIEDPVGILNELHNIELSISPVSHRTAAGGYADREIDIDLIAIDDEVCDTETLRLPHPRMSERMFVLQPLAWLDPAWRHPLSGMTAAEMLERLRKDP